MSDRPSSERVGAVIGAFRVTQPEPHEDGGWPEFQVEVRYHVPSDDPKVVQAARDYVYENLPEVPVSVLDRLIEAGEKLKGEALAFQGWDRPGTLAKLRAWDAAVREAQKENG